MARSPRIDLPGISQHVVQRGNDRQPCFFTDADRHCYLQNLKEIALREHCQVHAYVLMTNHVHLLMTPETSGQVARLMQALGRRYVRYVNDRYRRTGTPGRAATNPPSSIATPTCCAATATSS
ncbi:transposase [Dyella sp.]|jgi:putative transposase|uniref:transposase n=1 Tax=Dyella sp. TaxID=1869338 RepID=UPI002D78C273|nr:transposase [Dyella sp.]HET6432657.1 transposase [Dyella sp.]